MTNVTDLLSKLSVFDLKRLVAAKRLWSARTAVQERMQDLAGKLGQAKRFLGKLDRRLARLLRRANGTAPKRRSTGRRGPRKGSLRSYLSAALKKLGGSATARELANLALKAGYKTKSKIDVFVRAVQQALYVNKEFTRSGAGKYTLRG